MPLTETSPLTLTMGFMNSEEHLVWECRPMVGQGHADGRCSRTMASRASTKQRNA
jgi:hypothetical protein